MQKIKLFSVDQALASKVNDFLDAHRVPVEAFEVISSEDGEKRPVNVAVLRYDDGKEPK